MVNRVPIQPKLFGAYSTRHTFRFVHRKTSAISRSRFNEGREGRSCLSSVLLFVRSKRCQSFYFLSFSPPSLSFDTLHVAKVEEIHARRCILEQSFPENVSASRFSSPSSPRASPEWIGGWKFTRHGFRSSFALRSYGSRRSLERTVRIEISRLDISISVIPVERKANLLSRDLSVALITPSFLRGISPRRTFHVYTVIILFMKNRVFSLCRVISRCFVIFLLKRKKILVFDEFLMNFDQ